MEKNFITFVQNPELDILFGYRGITIPSKQEAFKPINAIGIDDGGKESILENFYVRNPSSKSVREFENLIKEQINNSSFKDLKILKPSIVEVTITVSLTKKRFFDIDLDNIAKTVLDSIKGILIEDDSQVANLICKKDTHPLNEQGFFIGLTELKENRKGMLGDFFLYSKK